ncbi:MAG: sigma-54-dependent Fis family transcriptional regulator, partial [gamma proteobacterium symbiont of Ctena orbiculata]
MQGKLNDMQDRSGFNEYRVLLVEDDEIMRLSLEDRLNLEQIPVCAVSNIASARKALEEGDIDLVVTDIRLSDGTGIELFSDITLQFPGIPVILMTAYCDISDAVTLVKAGALDYLAKPFDINDLIGKIEHHLSCSADRRLTHNNSDTENNFKPGSGFLGKSSAMRKIERLVARLGESDRSVLLTGESGVGKE